ncbi:MAG: aldo/keto reductase [Kiritimatiellae bacterium]|nr:aldo/keto reductase [Kiritimatiellia bacterium]
MTPDAEAITRRSFLRTLTLAGTCPWLPRAVLAETASALIPLRPLGRSGIEVCSLCLGGIFDVPANQHILHRALQLGVTCWDTADCYQGGRSETGFGQFLERQPEARKKVFLISKSDARDPEGLTRLLNRSLERLRTDYLDLYLIHDLRHADEMNGDMQHWAEAEKRAGRIRLFGFSTHRNMEQHVREGAKLGWIDAIMTSCNFRLLQQDGMKQALEQCRAAGVGVIAMKTQGGGPVLEGADGDMASQFRGRGFTAAQAKLKAVWEQPSIATICSQMHVMRNLEENAAAAMDRQSLSRTDRERLSHFARATCSGYCAGCEDLCGAALKGRVPVADVMRSLMYARAYGDIERARECYGAIPAAARTQLLSMDFTAAERRCPQGLPLTRLAREAAALLA